MIAFGDTPLITAAPLATGAAVAVLAFKTPNPTGYGRVFTGYYLPDTAGLAIEDGLTVALVSEAEAQGVNDRVQLSVAEAEIQGRLRRTVHVAGATLIAPESVDKALGCDVSVEHYVMFGPGVTVGDVCVVHAFSHLEGATLAAGVQIGPYARLRPGAVLETGARISNFVEVKNARMGAGPFIGSNTALVVTASVGVRAIVGAAR